MTSLLEVLAVIVLIGFMMTLAYPNFYLGEEKSELLHIGRLIKADLEQAAEDALINHSETVVAFTPDGYHFNLGDVNVDRRFNRIKFAIAFEEEKEPGTEADQDSGTEGSKDTEAGTSGESQNLEGETSGGSQEAEGEDSLSGSEVKFSPNGDCSGLTLAWEAPHFSGSLSIDSKGTVEWNYAQK
jgi:type II secretory pathway pseudopilin PulG